MLDLIEDVKVAMKTAVDAGGNLDVKVDANWNANQAPAKDHFRATVKHQQETY
jgi:hypothetical protein